MKRHLLIIRISVALSAIAAVGVMICAQIGVIPDLQVERRAARGQICETLGVSLSLGPIQKGPNAARQHMEIFARRNPQAVSLGLRQQSGELVAELGDHENQWRNASKERPDHCFMVPIIRDDEIWGNLEVVFQAEDGWFQFGSLPSWVAALMIVGLTVLVMSWLMLARILRHLDPSRVVPSRVRETLDTFAEGVVLLDQNERIVLANKAFAEKVGHTRESLTGLLARDLDWRSKNSLGETLPWECVARNGQPVRSASLQLDSKSGPQHYCVNAVPILDDRGSQRGTMAAFADVTELEEKKQNLATAMEKLSSSHNEIARKNKELEFLATRDPLTGCLNRRSLFASFEKHWDTARAGRELACIMVDIDFFKSINDNHGHQKGDDVLRATGELLLKSARHADLPARYGGEEFCIVLPETNLDDAERIAEQIRLNLTTLDFEDLRVTASLGISASSLGAPDPQGLIDQADKCLYFAKRNGRNQTARFDQIDQDLVVDEKLARTLEVPTEEVQLPYRCVSALLSTLAYRDPETAAHSMRVADLAVAIGRTMLSPREAYHLEVAALLHDIGKIGVPDSILLKPGPLDDEEWAIMRRHDRFGVEIVSASFGFEPVTEIIRHHHSRFEKQGKDQIPLGARIVCIADAFDAMTSDRPYRKGMSMVDAFAELRRCAGTQFDGELVELFCEIVERDYREVPFTREGVSHEVALNVGREIEKLIEAFETEDQSSISSLSQRISSIARQSRIDDVAEMAEQLSLLADGDSELIELVESVHELLRLANGLHANILDTVARSTADVSVN